MIRVMEVHLNDPGLIEKIPGNGRNGEVEDAA
jgi:hypothetical protein